MTEQLTLYTAKICPYAHRVELALEEAKADYTRFEIDLRNKPKWYAPEVNPASKVPAIAFGGPKVSPDKPSPDSQKIAESLILVEFIADLYPKSSLLPQDPVLRAKARFFIDTVSNKFVPGWMAAVIRGESFDALFQGIEAVQSLLPAESKGKYVLGNTFSIADAAAAPFFARMEVALKNDFGAFAEGEGKKVYNILQSDAKYARFKSYFLALKARDSFKTTFDEKYIVDQYSTRFLALRAQKHGL